MPTEKKIHIRLVVCWNVSMKCICGIQPVNGFISGRLQVTYQQYHNFLKSNSNKRQISLMNFVIYRVKKIWHATHSTLTKPNTHSVKPVVFRAFTLQDQTLMAMVWFLFSFIWLLIIVKRFLFRFPTCLQSFDFSILHRNLMENCNDKTHLTGTVQVEIFTVNWFSLHSNK